ncbi:MAG: acVLRF1 family peptidyl-tRNA hydrolase [Nocardioides sp.]
MRVPPARLGRWLANAERSHGPVELSVADGVLHGRADDGSELAVALPFEGGTPARPSWGLPGCRRATTRLGRPARAQGRLRDRPALGCRVTADKVGRRHVQGRTKAGGQSQQRFARRRANQARAAYEAAADHAARILAAAGPLPVVTGGDRTAVAEVLADPRLRHLRQVGPWLPVPEPRRAELEQATATAQALPVRVTNASPEAGQPEPS